MARRTSERGGINRQSPLHRASPGSGTGYDARKARPAPCPAESRQVTASSSVAAALMRERPHPSPTCAIRLQNDRPPTDGLIQVLGGFHRARWSASGLRTCFRDGVSADRKANPRTERQRADLEVGERMSRRRAQLQPLPIRPGSARVESRNRAQFHCGWSLGEHATPPYRSAP